MYSTFNSGILKRTLCLLALLLLLIPTIALADSVADLIPDISLWGISQDAFLAQNSQSFQSCKIGNKHALKHTDIDVDSYTMDGFYVFGEIMNDSSGYRYSGLSKITYVLNDSELFVDDLSHCYDALVGDLTEKAGQPDSANESVTKWNWDRYKVEIGKAKVPKYTGSNDITVIIVITGLNIPKPTLAPTPIPTPTPTPRPTATPSPQYMYLDYKGVSRNPERYQGQYVKFTGIVVQAMETSFVQYEGGSLFDDYYVLRVASKYERYEYFDGYSTDDIVYVVVPKDKVSGGRILDDDMVSIFGRYDGIENYTTILGGNVAIPRVEADSVIIN